MKNKAPRKLYILIKTATESMEKKNEKKKKKGGGEIKKRAVTNSAIHAKRNREGEKRKETGGDALCVSLSEGPQLPQ